MTSRHCPPSAAPDATHHLPPPSSACVLPGSASPHPSVLTPQGHHSNSSSAAGCSDVQRPSLAPSVHMAVTASCPAWPGHKGPSSVPPPSAEREWTGHLRDEGSGKAWEKLWGGGSHRKAPLPWWRWQRHTGGRPRMGPLPLQGLGLWERGSPGDKLNNGNTEGRPLMAAYLCMLDTGTGRISATSFHLSPWSCCGE